MTCFLTNDLGSVGWDLKVSLTAFCYYYREQIHSAYHKADGQPEAKASNGWPGFAKPVALAKGAGSDPETKESERKRPR
jgi:hypothetical protein